MTQLAFVGDIMIGRDVHTFLSSEGSSGKEILGRDIELFFKEADAVIANLECPVTDQSPILKGGLKGSPEHLNKLSFVDFFSLANNHALDCGSIGLIDTIANLEQRRFQHGGTASDSRIKISELSVDELTVGILCCSYDYCYRAGKASYPKMIKADTNDCFNAISSNKHKYDLLIAYIHGGVEMVPFPEPKFKALCEQFIDDGCDVVITNHPHVIGAIDRYKNGLIAYSLGDFIFDGKSSKRRNSMILKIWPEGEKKFKFDFAFSTINQDLSVELATSEKSRDLFAKVNKRSRLLKSKYYNKLFPIIHVSYLFSFQLDRIIFLIRQEGWRRAGYFLLSRLKFIPAHVKKVLSRKG